MSEKHVEEPRSETAKGGETVIAVRISNEA